MLSATHPDRSANVSGKSVTQRAFAFLMSFDVTHRRMTLSQISRRTGLPVACHHIPAPRPT
ncbi:helix-turn-helix domain-containing protein [Williamsia muralis]|uniref:helix-turn-helix domain-containing protein n=1 Tax=Williamsia marianensis TaxID=85044 RepID=UPI00157E2AF6